MAGHVGIVLAVCMTLWQEYSDAQTPFIFPIGGMFGQHHAQIRPSHLQTEHAFDKAIQQVNNMRSSTNQLDNDFVPLVANKRRLDVDDPYSLSSAYCRLLGDGVFALFGSHTMNTMDTVRSYGNAFKMPYVSIGPPVENTGITSYEIFMRPLYTKAILEVIVYMYPWWNKIYYMYNSQDGLERYQQLLNLIRSRKLPHRLIMIRVFDAEDAYKTLEKIDRKEEEDKHIILDMPTDQTKALLTKQVRETRQLHHHYFLAGLDLEELNMTSVFQRGGMNATGFKIVDYDSVQVGNFLRKLKSDSTQRNLDEKTILPHHLALARDGVRLISKALARLQANNSNIFRKTLRQGKVYNNGSDGIECSSDPVIPWVHGHQILQQLKKTRLDDGLTGLVEFDELGLRKNFKLILLEVTKDSRLAELAQWYSSNELLILKKSPTFVRPKPQNNKENRTRIVTSILTAPYLSKIEGKEGNEQYEGYCADLTRKIADLVKIDYEIVPVADEKYGKELDNGTWDGMVGELVSHKADLAIAPLTITSQREKVIHFSKPFQSLGISIMILKNPKEAPGVFSFMYPLSYEIWMCVIFAYIGVSVVLFLVSRFSPYEWHIEDNTDGPTVTNNFTIFNSLWFSLGAFMQQGCDIEPRSMSGRIVGSVWWFFTLIIISSYTANLAAFLTVSRMQSPIESAEDLAKQTEIKYGTVSGGSTEAFFKMSDISTYERMWAFMTSEPGMFVKSNEEGIAKVRQSKGRYAFLMESTTNDYYNQRHPCNTMKVGNNLDSKGYGVGTPIGSDLRDHINLAVLVLRETGVLRELENKWWYVRGTCGNKKGSTTQKQEATNSLKLSNVAGIFYILIAGLVLSLSMAFIEFMYKSRTEANRRKTSFSNAVRSKAKLSLTGKVEQQTTAVGIS